MPTYTKLRDIIAAVQKKSAAYASLIAVVKKYVAEVNQLTVHDDTWGHFDIEIHALVSKFTPLKGDVVVIHGLGVIKMPWKKPATIRGHCEDIAYLFDAFGELHSPDVRDDLDLDAIRPYFESLNKWYSDQLLAARMDKLDKTDDITLCGQLVQRVTFSGPASSRSSIPRHVYFGIYDGTKPKYEFPCHLDSHKQQHFVSREQCDQWHESMKSMCVYVEIVDRRYDLRHLKAGDWVALTGLYADVVRQKITYDERHSPNAAVRVVKRGYMQTELMCRLYPTHGNESDSSEEIAIESSQSSDLSPQKEQFAKYGGIDPSSTLGRSLRAVRVRLREDNRFPWFKLARIPALIHTVHLLRQAQAGSRQYAVHGTVKDIFPQTLAADRFIRAKCNTCKVIDTLHSSVEQSEYVVTRCQLNHRFDELRCRNCKRGTLSLFFEFHILINSVCGETLLATLASFGASLVFGCSPQQVRNCLLTLECLEHQQLFRSN